MSQWMGSAYISFFDHCLLQSKSETIAGVWPTDFEWIVFQEGANVPPEQYWKFPRDVKQLEFVHDHGLPERDKVRAAAMRRRFIGLREPCNLSPGTNRIIAVRILSSSIADKRRSFVWQGG